MNHVSKEEELENKVSFKTEVIKLRLAKQSSTFGKMEIRSIMATCC